MKRFLNSTEYAQPAIFVVEYALATLWMSLGISAGGGLSVTALASMWPRPFAGALPLEDGASHYRHSGAHDAGSAHRMGSWWPVRATEAQAEAAVQEIAGSGNQA